MGKVLNGLLLILVGLTVSFVGYGMYRSPHLNWEGFLGAMRESVGLLIGQVAYFIDDPFAFVGFIVLLVGLALLGKGVMTVFAALKREPAGI